MRRRRRLAALALAQCGAFAIVLILSAFSRSGQPQAALTVSLVKVVTPTSPPTSVPPTSVPPTGFGPIPTGTGRALTSGSFTAALQWGQVVTLNAATLAPVVSGRLNSQGILSESVPENNSYVICLRPPQGWTSDIQSAYQLPGWICTGRYVGAAGANVNFRIVPGAGGSG